MIKKMFMALFSLMCIAQASHAGVWDNVADFFNRPLAAEQDSLKILVVHNKPGAVVEVKGKYKLYDPNTNSLMSTRFVGKRKYIQPMKDGLKWGEEFPGTYQILILPDDKNTTTIVDGIEYSGKVYIYDIGGSISIVNEIPFDEYVRILLSSKLQQPIPEEALAALVITARTNAYYLKQNAPNNFWTIEAKDIDYQGHALANPSDEISRVIKATHDMVMTSSSKPFLAQWEIIDSGEISKAKPVEAKISINQAVMFAHQGEHAAQILKKAFPNAQMDLIK